MPGWARLNLVARYFKFGMFESYKTIRTNMLRENEGFIAKKNNFSPNIFV